MRRVGIHMLTPNMILAKPLVHTGRLLLKAGTMNLEKYRKNFDDIGINSLYIEDINSEGIVIPDIIDEELRTECKFKLGEVFQGYAKKSVVNLLPLYQVIKSIVEEVYYAQDVALSLNDVSSKEDDLVRHSVNTAVYAAIIGKEMGYDQALIQKLLFGAILHDIGELKINPKIMMKRTPWTPEEMEEYKKHVTIGYEALKSIPDLTELSKIIVLSHHEKLDGSGYPKRAKGDSIHSLVRIASIADRFDDLVSGRGNGIQKHSVNQAMECLQQESAAQLDAGMNAKFMQRISVYPNGTMVRLSNHCIAIVKEQNKRMAYRPVIRIITDERGNNIDFKEVDLMKELSLTIVESEIENSYKGFK